MEQGHDSGQDYLDNSGNPKKQEIIQVSAEKEENASQEKFRDSEASVKEWVRQDYQLIANRFNKNFEILSNKESLVNYLSQYLSDSPELFEAVCCAYDKGILSFFQQKCDNNAREIRRMVRAIQKKTPAGGSGYRFWSEIIPLLTPQTLNFAVSCSPKWHNTFSNDAKSACLSGCIIMASVVLLFCIGFLILTMKQTEGVRNFFTRPTQSSIKSSNRIETTQKPVKESTKEPTAERTEQKTISTIFPTSIPTATMIPTEMPPLSNILDHFIENVNNGDVHTERRYLVTQMIPEKGKIESFEDVFEKIGSTKNKESFPKWELIIEVSKSMDLPPYLELPTDVNLMKVTIQNTSEKRITLSGKKPTNVENLGLNAKDSIASIFGKGSDASTIISNWCDDQLFDFANANGLVGTISDVHPDTFFEMDKSTGVIIDNEPDDNSTTRVIPESRKSSLTKEEQLPFLFTDHGSIIVTNGITLEIGEQIELKDNSIYNGPSTKTAEVEQQIVNLSAAEVIILGKADAVFLGGLAYNVEDRVSVDTSLAEIHGIVNKVYTGGMALDYHSTVITNHPTINYVFVPGEETIISEIQVGGVNLAVGGIVDTGELTANSPIGESTINREDLPNYCKP